MSNPSHDGQIVGRVAGQFAKPRSEPFEVRDGVKLPGYGRNNVNGDAFDEKCRRPDPQRLLRAYLQSIGTLNLLRAFATVGYAAMQRVSDWNLDFIEHSEQGNRYMEFAERVDETIGFLSAVGATGDNPMDPTELVKLCEVRNPHNKPGRRTIITRMGAQIRRLIRAVRQAGFFVTWVGWITDWSRNDRLKSNNDCQVNGTSAA